MTGYIDFYTVQPNDPEQDFTKALALVAGDDDAEAFVENLRRKILGGPDSDDMDEFQTINGVQTLILQYHNGVSDGGDQQIANAEWFARTYPQAFKALGVTISWGKGTGALVGNPQGTV